MQGFPDFKAPEHVVKSLQQVIASENPFLQQYTRSFVCPILLILQTHPIALLFCMVKISPY